MQGRPPLKSLAAVNAPQVDALGLIYPADEGYLSDFGSVCVTNDIKITWNPATFGFLDEVYSIYGELHDTL